MKNFKKFTQMLPARQKSIRVNHQDEILPEALAAFKDVNFSFRIGFSDRLMIKFNRVLEREPITIYYKNLSRLFPKIIGFSFATIILMGLILIALHGSLSPDKFVGADRIDENNFISYLIFEK